MSDLAGVEGFTPGPLFVSGTEFHRTVVRRYDNNDGLGVRERPVASMEVRGNHDAEQLANAKLFAAAPTMYAELSRLRTALEKIHDADSLLLTRSDILAIAREALRPALEGEKT